MLFRSQVNLDALKDRATFFFNLRSLLLLHDQARSGVATSCESRLDQFNTVQYMVGPYRFSIADVSHGILRSNESGPESLLAKHFDKKDPRVKYTLKASDERVVFAFCLGITLDPFHVSSQRFDLLGAFLTPKGSSPPILNRL